MPLSTMLGINLVHGAVAFDLDVRVDAFSLTLV